MASMDVTALLLSRLQFAFTVSFHIIFPSFTIGLAMWLTVLEALGLATGRPVYHQPHEQGHEIPGHHRLAIPAAAVRPDQQSRRRPCDRLPARRGGTR